MKATAKLLKLSGWTGLRVRLDYSNLHQTVSGNELTVDRQRRFLVVWQIPTCLLLLVCLKPPYEIRMSISGKLDIDPSEPFERLANPPIVEAVIGVRCRAAVALEEGSLTETLKAKLPEYQISSMRTVQHGFKLLPVEQKPQQMYEDLGWTGCVCRSSDNRQIATFSKDSFAFHRLQPYESWQQFSSEALRLWRVHLELAQPPEVQALGLRFINKIAVSPQTTDLAGLLTTPPKAPVGLPLNLLSFLHTTNFVVPGHPYSIQVLQALQNLQLPANQELALILDIDASVPQPFEPRPGLVEVYLGDLRWLKNKIFFGSLTPETVEKFK